MCPTSCEPDQTGLSLLAIEATPFLTGIDTLTELALYVENRWQRSTASGTCEFVVLCALDS